MDRKLSGANWSAQMVRVSQQNEFKPIGLEANKRGESQGRRYGKPMKQVAATQMQFFVNESRICAWLTRSFTIELEKTDDCQLAPDATKDLRSEVETVDDFNENIR